MPRAYGENILQKANRKTRRFIRKGIRRLQSKFLKVVNAQGKIHTKDLVNMIFDFCQLYSGIIFYPYQEMFSKRVIRSVLENDGEEITALFSRQSGKLSLMES